MSSSDAVIPKVESTDTATLTTSSPETASAIAPATSTSKRPLEDPSSPSAPDEPDAKRPALDKSTAVKTESDGDVAVKHEGDGDTKVPDAPSHGATSNIPPVDESNWIHMRAIISSQEAATVIGKGGENVTQIRRMAEAKCTVSEYSRGAVERILTVSGGVDGVAKVCSKNSIV